MTQGDEEMQARQVRGTVKWFDRSKGFGFIVSDEGGPDILLHANALRGFGQSSVCDASVIMVSVQETPRGLQTLEVLDIQPPPDTFASHPDALVFDPAVDGIELLPARVKWFDKAKGFGFCNVFGEVGDVFVHMEVLRRSGYADLQPGEGIGVRVIDGDRGRMAAAVAPWETALRERS